MPFRTARYRSVSATSHLYSEDPHINCGARSVSVGDVAPSRRRIIALVLLAWLPLLLLSILQKSAWGGGVKLPFSSLPMWRYRRSCSSRYRYWLLRS